MKPRGGEGQKRRLKCPPGFLVMSYNQPCMVIKFTRIIQGKYQALNYDLNTGSYNNSINIQILIIFCTYKYEKQNL